MDQFSKSVPQLCQNILKTAANVICMDKQNNASEEILKSLRGELVQYCKNIEKYKKINETCHNILSESEDKRDEVISQYYEDINLFNPDVTDNQYIKEYDNNVAALMKNTIGTLQNDTCDDGELQMANNINLICPISKTKMTEPMENTICGHVYDKSSVISLLNMSKNTRCPIIGCSNKEFLKMDHLKCDIVTQLCMENSVE